MKTKLYLFFIALMLTVGSLQAQRQVYGDMHLYGDLKMIHTGIKATSDTLIIWNSTDSMLYKMPASALSASGYKFRTIDEGGGGLIVNDTADRLVISGLPETYTEDDEYNFINLEPYTGNIQLYPDEDYTHGGSVTLMDFSKRPEGDAAYIGRHAANTDTRNNYITFYRNSVKVFQVDTVGNVSVAGTLRLKDSWKSSVTPQLGDLYFDTSDSTLRLYTGSSFETVTTTP